MKLNGYRSGFACPGRPGSSVHKQDMNVPFMAHALRQSYSMNMAEGPPPNKRPKTDENVYQLENLLPDELVGDSGMPTANNGYPLVSSHAVSQTPQMSVATVLSSHSGQQLPTTQTHKHITQLLQNSPKHVQSSSPNSNNSPRPQPQHTPHPQPSPLSTGQISMQSPTAGTMNAMRNNLKSPPASLPRPNSRPNSAISATPSPRPVQMAIGTMSSGAIGTSIAATNPMRMAPNQMPPNVGTHPMSLSSSVPTVLATGQEKMTIANGMTRINQGPVNIGNDLQNDMGMNMGGQQILTQPGNFVGQPRMPTQGNAMFSMAPTSNNYGSYGDMQTGQRQLPVNTGNFNNPSMARPPSVSGGMMGQGVANQNHLGNGIMMGEKPGDGMQMLQQQSNMGMMGGMEKSNVPMQQMRTGMPMVQPGNVQRPNPQVQDMGGGMITQDSGQQQQQPIQIPSNMHTISNINQPQGTGQDQMVNMPVHSQPGSAATSTPVDPEKRRLIQQQLVLLLHAYKCSKKEQSGDTTNCALPHCRTMKDVLRHMNVCSQGKSCQVAHCASSRQIIAHWRACKRPECEVCLPLKSVPTNSSGAPSTSMQQTWPTLAPQMGQSSTANHAPGPSSGPSYGGNFNEGMLDPNSLHQPNQAQPGIGNMPNGVNVSQVSGMVARTGQGSDSGNFFHPPRVEHPWHSDVKEELRNHLVQKLVQAIFPTPQKVSLTDERMKKLVNFARKVECDMYEQAKSRSEYYHLLAEKIYKIQKELEEKRASRNRTNPGARMATPNGPIRMTTMNPVAPVRMPGVGMNPRMSGNTGMRFSQPMTNTPVTQNKVMESMLQSTGINQNPQMEDPMMMKFQQATDEIRHQRSGDGQIQNSQFSAQPNVVQDSNMVSNGGTMVNNSMVDVFGGSQPDLKPNIGQSSMEGMAQGQGVQNSSNNTGMPTSTFDMKLTSGQPRLEKLLRETNPTPSSSAAVQSSGSFYGSAPHSNQQPQTQQRLPYNTGDPAKNQTGTLQEILQGSGPGSSASSGSTMSNTRSFVSLSSSNTSTSNVLTSPPPFVSTQPGVESKPGGYLASASQNSSIKTETSVDSGVGVSVKEEPGEKSMGFDKGKPWSPNRNNISVKTEPKMESNDQFPTMSQADSTASKTITNHDPFVKQEIGESQPSKTTKIPQKVFDPLELKENLMPVLEKLFMLEPESVPFRQPVDPDKLNIPDYFDIVKNPMDLSSIRKGLETGKYKDPWEFIADVWLMFNNAWLYNRRTTRIYKFCTKLKDLFESEIDPVMQRLGFCCGRKLEFMPMTLCCYGKQLCTIPTGAVYYDYQNRYDYCEKCFNEIPGDAISLADDPSQPQSSITTIPKSQFEKKKNDVLDPEPFEVCNACGRKMHKICVLHMSPIWPEGFTCNECLSRRGTQRKPNRYISMKLPQNKLSEHIERRVNGYIKRNDTTGAAGRVHIRVVYSGDKTVEVRPGMKAKFVDTKEMPETFPYRAKAFFAFEEIDGVDVCFFGVHVQEYGSDAPRPNQRRIYLSYLDSVHFFRPKHLRTAVYHEILIGYFEYCKNLGYEFAHIWACPPCEGDDYIFHCHPSEQKIPKPKRLQDWYKKMLDKAISEQVIVDYKDIFHQAKEDRLQSARELPYFEGDFWPNVLEESIKEIEQEEEDRKQAEASEQAAAEEALLFKFSPLQSDQGTNSGLKNGKQNKKSKKANIKKTSQRTTKKKAPQIMNDLSDKLYQIMEKHKEVFFVIRLNTVEAISKMGPTVDPDPTQQCDLMDGRDAFLTMAREKHFEFSSLRRAKWSTMAMLIELHTSGQDKFTYMCNRCRNNVETRYQCTVCHDYDLCIPCYNATGHEHKMDKVGFGIDDGTLGSPGSGSHNTKSTISVETCLRSLVHASQCRNANCNMPACYTMKKVVQHAKNCKKKSHGTCLICKQLIALCYYHARHCQEVKCPVTFCQNIKAKMKEQERQHRVRQQHLMKRRMMMTQKSNPPSGPHTPAGGSNAAAKSQPSPKITASQESGMTQPMQTEQKIHPINSQGMIISPQAENTMTSPMMNQSQIASPLRTASNPGHIGKPGSGLAPQPVQQPGIPNPAQPGFGGRASTYQSPPPEAAVRAAQQAQIVADKQARERNNVFVTPSTVQNPGALPGNRTNNQGPRTGNPNPNPNSTWGMNNQLRPMPGQQNQQMTGLTPQAVSGNQGSATGNEMLRILDMIKRENASGAAGQRGTRPKNSEQLMDYLKRNPLLMNQIIRQRRQASASQQPMTPRQPMTPNNMPTSMGGGMQQQATTVMQPTNMQSSINQPRMNMPQQVNSMQQPMQWQQQQPQTHRIQQQQHQPVQFSNPAPPYPQAISQQQRVMNIRYQQQPRMTNQIRHQQVPMNQVVMQPGMSPQMSNLQQSLQSPPIQHHPNMTAASKGVPVSHPPSQQMTGRPSMQQIHPMAGRNTPMNQNQGTVPQHMVSNMDQGFNVGGSQQQMMGGGFSHPASQGTGFNTAAGAFQTNVNVNQGLGHMNNPNSAQGNLDAYGKINDK